MIWYPCLGSISKIKVIKNGVEVTGTNTWTQDGEQLRGSINDSDLVEHLSIEEYPELYI